MDVIAIAKERDAIQQAMRALRPGQHTLSELLMSADQALSWVLDPERFQSPLVRIRTFWNGAWPEID